MGVRVPVLGFRDPEGDQGPRDAATNDVPLDHIQAGFKLHDKRTVMTTQLGQGSQRMQAISNCLSQQ